MKSTRSAHAGSTGDSASHSSSDDVTGQQQAKASQAESAAPARKARTANTKAQDTDTSPEATSASVIQTWPFAAGSQGDNKPLPSRPVQKAGWNARQFRI